MKKLNKNLKTILIAFVISAIYSVVAFAQQPTHIKFLITQTGTSAPTLNILENNTGCPWNTTARLSKGRFALDSTCIVDVTKTSILTQTANSGGVILTVVPLEAGSGHELTIYVTSDSSPWIYDGLLKNTTVDVWLYP